MEYADVYHVEYTGERLMYKNYILPTYVELPVIDFLAIPIVPKILHEQEVPVPESIEKVDTEDMEKALLELQISKSRLNMNRASSDQFKLVEIRQYATRLGIKPFGSKKDLVAAIKNKMIELGY